MLRRLSVLAPSGLRPTGPLAAVLVVTSLIAGCYCSHDREPLRDASASIDAPSLEAPMLSDSSPFDASTSADAASPDASTLDAAAIDAVAPDDAPPRPVDCFADELDVAFVLREFGCVDLEVRGGDAADGSVCEDGAGIRPIRVTKPPGAGEIGIALTVLESDGSGAMGVRYVDVDACTCTRGGASRAATVGERLVSAITYRDDHASDFLLGLPNTTVLYGVRICYEPR